MLQDDVEAILADPTLTAVERAETDSNANLWTPMWSGWHVQSTASIGSQTVGKRIFTTASGG
jgi:hypothetical protein